MKNFSTPEEINALRKVIKAVTDIHSKTTELDYEKLSKCIVKDDGMVLLEFATEPTLAIARQVK